MEWLTIIASVISGSVAAGGAIWGMRVQILANKEAQRREIELLRQEMREANRETREELRECRGRIDQLLAGKPHNHLPE